MQGQVGAIGEAHGLRGDVKVIPLTDFIEQRFKKSAEFRLKTSNRMGARSDRARDRTLLTISTLRFVQGKSPGLVIKFREINTRDEAEGLKGFLLMVPHNQRPELDSDESEFYASDLIGLEVKHDSTGQTVGRVKDMADLGAPNLLMEVEIIAGEGEEEEEEEDDDDGDDGESEQSQRQTVLVPFVKELVPTVDLENGVIGISPPDGLLEMYRNKKGDDDAETSVKPPTAWRKRRRRDDVRKLKQRMAESKSMPQSKGDSALKS